MEPPTGFVVINNPAVKGYLKKENCDLKQAWLLCQGAATIVGHAGFWHGR
jgi:hypothetical protein